MRELSWYENGANKKPLESIAGDYEGHKLHETAAFDTTPTGVRRQASNGVESAKPANHVAIEAAEIDAVTQANRVRETFGQPPMTAMEIELAKLRRTLDGSMREDAPRRPPATPEELERARQLEENPLRALTMDEFATLKPVSERLNTGFPTLDEATRGGLPLGRYIVLAGAPGAAKTTMATWMAHNWEKAGALVTFIAADEPAAGIFTRLGQLSQFSRSAIEADDREGNAVRDSLALSIQQRRFYVVDPDTTGLALEDIGAMALKQASAENRPCVLVIDSLQTVKCAAAAKFDNPREKINAVVAEAKRLAKRGALVVGLSEMARSGYRDPANRISALSASKESGSIEYGVSLLLGLTSVPNESGVVEVEVAKNRIGPEKPVFRVRLDFERASLSEVGAVDVVARRAEATAAKQDDLRQRIRDAVVTHPGLRSRDQIVSAAKMKNKEAQHVITEMMVAGELLKGATGAYELGPTA